MFDDFYLGLAPTKESPENTAECAERYCKLLKGMFTNLPVGVYFHVKVMPHDFGPYYGVYLHYMPDIERHEYIRCNAELRQPEHWHDISVIDMSKQYAYIKLLYGINESEGKYSPYVHIVERSGKTIQYIRFNSMRTDNKHFAMRYAFAQAVALITRTRHNATYEQGAYVNCNEYDIEADADCMKPNPILPQPGDLILLKGNWQGHSGKEGLSAGGILGGVFTGGDDYTPLSVTFNASSYISGVHRRAYVSSSGGPATIGGIALHNLEDMARKTNRPFWTFRDTMQHANNAIYLTRNVRTWVWNGKTE